MRETVLLYNMTDGERAGQIKRALLPLGFRLRSVSREDFLKPVGSLAGVKGIDPVDEVYDGPGFEDEMLLMAGLTSRQVDMLLMAFRRAGIERVDYKAVLTDTNQRWNSLELYLEIKKEHEIMSPKSPK